MSPYRKIVHDLVEDLPEDKLRDAIEALEKISGTDQGTAWDLWGKLGEDAVEGAWPDASENHDAYLYRVKRF